jgi:hypothetical protein
MDNIRMGFGKVRLRNVNVLNKKNARFSKKFQKFSFQMMCQHPM